MTRAFADGAHADTREALRASVAQESTRDLIDRLKLSIGPFDDDAVVRLACVPPAIDRPRERLASIAGVWAQRVDASRWRLSPLLDALPDTNLDSAVVARCHCALAERLQSRTLDQQSTVTAVTHWARGGQPDLACATLATMIDALVRDPRPLPHGLLLELWWSTLLPDGTQAGFGIWLRQAQLRAAARFGLDGEGPARELDALLEAATSRDAWAAVGVLVERFQAAFDERPAVAGVAMRKALSIARAGRLPDDAPYPDRPVRSLVWMAARRVTNRLQLAVWLDLLAVCTSFWADTEFDRALVTRCSMSVCEALWMREEGKAVGVQRWGDVHEDLERVLAAAKKIGSPILAACALRVKITLLWEREAARVKRSRSRRSSWRSMRATRSASSSSRTSSGASTSTRDTPPPPWSTWSARYGTRLASSQTCFALPRTTLAVPPRSVYRTARCPSPRLPWRLPARASRCQRRSF